MKDINWKECDIDLHRATKGDKEEKGEEFAAKYLIVCLSENLQTVQDEGDEYSKAKLPKKILDKICGYKYSSFCLVNILNII